MISIIMDIERFFSPNCYYNSPRTAQPLLNDVMNIPANAPGSRPTIFCRKVMRLIKVLILMATVIRGIRLTIMFTYSSSINNILFTPQISLDIIIGKPRVHNLLLMPTTSRSLPLLFLIFGSLGWFPMEAWLWDPYLATWVSFLPREWLQPTIVPNIFTRLCRLNSNLFLTLLVLGLFQSTAPLMKKLPQMKD